MCSHYEGVRNRERFLKHFRAVRNTYNARVETVATKPTFRSAWRKAQHCIVPADAFYEPDYRLNPTRSVPAKISRADESPMGIAGLWESWTAPDGSKILSITLLTINADDHPLMKNFHKPTDEKRMVVILPEEKYGAWLSASAEESLNFCMPYPAEKMVATSDVSPGSLL